MRNRLPPKSETGFALSLQELALSKHTSPIPPSTILRSVLNRGESCLNAVVSINLAVLFPVIDHEHKDEEHGPEFVLVRSLSWMVPRIPYFPPILGFVYFGDDLLADI